MSFPYPNQRYTTYLGLSLFGMDEVLADNMNLIDAAYGAGSSINVNGTLVLSPNLSDTTPAAPSGNTNVIWQHDSNGNVSASVISSSSSGGSFFTPTGVASPTPIYTPPDGPSDMNYCIYIQDANGYWHEQAGVNTTISNSGTVNGTLTWVRQQYYTDTAAPALLPGKNAFMAINHASGVNLNGITNQDRAVHIQQSNIYGAITSYSIAASNVVTFNMGAGSTGFNSGQVAFVPGQVVYATGLTTTDGLLLNYWFFQVQSSTKTKAVVVPYPFSLTAVANASGGNTTYTGTIWQGSVHSFAGATVTINDFGNPTNNGTFTVVSNTYNSITVNNASGVAETHAGSIQVSGLPTTGLTVDSGALNQPIYGMEGLQIEVDVVGTPLTTGSPDGEIAAGSFQVNDSCVGNPSSPNSLGLCAVRAQTYRNGTGNFSDSPLAYTGVNAIVQQNNATSTAAAPINMAAIYAQAIDFAGAAYAVGYAINVPFTHRFAFANYGLYLADYGSTGNCALNVTAVANASGGNTVYTITAPNQVLTTNSLAHIGSTFQFFTVSGCQNAANNGTFRVVSNTTTTVTLSNASGVAESGSSGKAFSTNDYAIYSVGGQVYIGGTITSNTTFSGNPAFTGTPTFSNPLALGSSTATTQTSGDNSTKLATTAYVDSNRLWSSLGNASANLTLSNAGFTTEFDQTSAVTWTWKNTTASTLGSNVSSPILSVFGSYFGAAGGSLAASAVDSWSMQDVLASNLVISGASQITHISESAGSVVTLTFSSPSVVPSAGQTWVVTGLSAGTWLNGYAVTLLTGSNSSCTFNDPTSHGTLGSTILTGTPVMTKVSGLSNLTFTQSGSPADQQVPTTGFGNTVNFANASTLIVGTMGSVAGAIVLAGSTSANGLCIYSNQGAPASFGINQITSAGVLAGGAITLTANGGFNLIGSTSTELSLVNGSTWTTGTGGFINISPSSNISTLSITDTTAATSGQSQSAAVSLIGKYWTGAASASDTFTIENQVGNGTNGAVSLVLSHSGSSGFVTVTLPDSGAAPTSAGTAGTAGQMAYHSGVLYFCSVTGGAGSAIWNTINITAIP